jgi:hypothetical protein
MSVYVEIDVHRKRSQVAVVDHRGEVLANRNVSNGVQPPSFVPGPDRAPAVHVVRSLSRVIHNRDVQSAVRSTMRMSSVTSIQPGRRATCSHS